jgi:hypothetical protein
MRSYQRDDNLNEVYNDFFTHKQLDIPVIKSTLALW